MKKRYIAKFDTWFDEGTEAFLREYYGENANGISIGCFEGWKTFDEEYARAKNKSHLGLQWDSEVCNFDEFDIIEYDDMIEDYMITYYKIIK